MKSGIYEIKNVINGKRYIGSSINCKKRWLSHCSDLKRNKHRSRYLQHAWNKYGSSAFRFRLIRSTAICYLIAFEQYYIDHIKPEYNLAPIAGSSLGVKHTDQMRARVAAASRGNKNCLGRSPSAETRAKIGDAGRGRVVTQETRANISAATLGKRKSAEHSAKIGAAKRGNKYMLGYKHSPEALAKMSVAQKGKIISPEARAKMAAAKLGKTMHPKTRAAILAANTGSKRTPEQRAKMSESAKRRWNKPN